MFTTYILHSDERDRYYVGSTSMEMEERLRRHQSHHKGYTGGVADWIVVYKQEFADQSATLDLEKRIKKRGAKRFLEDLA